jgi:DNA repair protein RadA/Sms
LSKSQRSYVCGDCGTATVKWQGQCPACGEWNSLQPAKSPAGRVVAGKNWAGSLQVERLDAVSGEVATRRTTGLGELDRVLGGGLVAGSVTLLGGDPGIGKSTLLLQACVAFSVDATMLYVSGEESLQQIALRARRLGLDSSGITVYAATDIDAVVALAEQERPAALIIDSVQTIYSTDMPSAPGSVNQLRECTARLVRLAKVTGIPVILVGHVTKEGNIAGPRVLEHMVDTVLYFEGDRGHQFRIMRAVKNRFGGTDEIGAEAVECVHPIRDLHVTMLHLMGLDDNKLTYFHGGRYKQLSQFGGQLIPELLA